MYSEKNGHRKKLDFFDIFICRFYRCFGDGGLVAKMCLTLATPWTVACQAPLSMGFLQARILEWVAISFSNKCVTQSINNFIFEKEFLQIKVK